MWSAASSSASVAICSASVLVGQRWSHHSPRTSSEAHGIAPRPRPDPAACHAPDVGSAPSRARAAAFDSAVHSGIVVAI
eukprot:scaffold3855_cov108-Isochrysis_galbana.AAC.3